MFFRFSAGLLLVVAVSMAQVVLEKQSLHLRRLVSRQYYQMDELLELHAQLRLEIQQLAAPSRWFERSGTAPDMSRLSKSVSAYDPSTRSASPKRALLRQQRRGSDIRAIGQ